MSEPGKEIEFSQELIDLMRPMITSVPDYEPGTGEDILMRLLKGKTIEDMEAPFKGREFPLDRPWIIEGIAKAPSDYSEGLGFYLVANCIDPTNGEQVVYNTGSGNIIGQLLLAHVNGLYPIRAIARKAKKPSKNGFFPQRLEEITPERPTSTPAEPAKASK